MAAKGMIPLKRNVLFGILLYIVFLVVSGSQLQVLEAVVLLSVLVFVPVLLMLVDATKRDGTVMLLHRWIGAIYPFAALCAMLALAADLYIFAVIWLAFTGLVALYGLRRIMERGLRPLAETAVDIGLIYLFGGGFWFFAAAAHLRIMEFTDMMIMLTAVHFHYSSLVIPILMGFLGRKPLKNRKLYQISAVIILLAPAGVAAGIAYSTVLEFIVVAAYLIALYSYGFMVFTAPFGNKNAKLLVSFSALVLMVTIAFSLIYALGRVMNMGTIPIDRMIWIHGVVNAVGVILPALAGWMLEKSAPALVAYGKPMSRITGGGFIGRNFLIRRGLLDDKAAYSGLVDQMNSYDSQSFAAGRLSSIVRDFYENTGQYSMQADIQWAGWFRPLAAVYEFISRRVQQIHLGMRKGWQPMTGSILPVSSEKDGRECVRAWQRLNEQGEAIFTALYSQHRYQDVMYMNIALPLPGANMTGILRPCNEGSSLILTSASAPERKGDEGIYLHSTWFTLQLPLTETFLIKKGERPEQLTAHHQMWICGLQFLEIDYKIERKE